MNASAYNIVLDVICAIAALLFVAIMWKLIIEARGDYDDDEHRGGGIG